MKNLLISYCKYIMKNNLKKYRLKAKLTQKQVAEMLELDCENRLCRWESGQAMPSVKNLFRLCEIYKITPHQLYETSNAKLLKPYT